MTLQARLSKDDPRLYNPNRDVAHCFRGVVEHVAARLEDRAWPELDAILTREGVTMDDLGAACAALCKFVVPDSPETMRLGMHESLDRAGWWELPAGAQVGLMAILGTVILGYHFAGVREATLQGEGPVLSLQGLAEMGAETARYIAMPRWRRWFHRRWRRIRQAVRVLRGQTE